MLRRNSVWTCGIVIFELLQGIRLEGEKKLFLKRMKDFSYVEMTKNLWNKPVDLSVLLKEKGPILPRSDIFMESLAIEHNLSIFIFDKHLNQIPDVKIYKV